MSEPASKGEVNVSAQTARGLLIAWANGQDSWIRSAVSQVLAVGSLDTGALDQIYVRYLAEKGLGAEIPDPFPMLEVSDGDPEDDSNLRLIKLAELSGVNALAADQVIDFNENLTVIFGENGAGKTGYTRVLKRAAKARSAEPIIDNVLRASGATPSAKITWSVDGVQSEAVWSNEHGWPPLDRIDVFDSPAVMLHLDSDLTYSYTPADLALFEHVASAIRSVSEHAAKDQATRAQKRPTFIQLFERGTAVYPLIETLSAASDIAALREAAMVTPEEEASLSTLEQTVAALQTDNITAQLAVARSREAANVELLVLIEAVSSFDQAAYLQALADLATAKEAEAALKVVISNTYSIPGADSPTWDAFVKAGEAYRAHLQLHDYPGLGDECLYCRQPLGQSEVAVLAAYRDLATNATQTTIANATAMAERLSAALRGVDCDRLTELHEAQRGEAPDAPTEAALTLVAGASTARKRLESLEPVDVEPLGVGLDSLRASATERVAASHELAGELSGRAEERRGRLADSKRALTELTARIRLKQNLNEVESYVEDAKWLARLKVTADRLPSTLASLTNATKRAGELLLNGSFDERFKEEQRLLRAPDVSLEFPGRRGTTRRLKTVVAHKPSEILSEGEQKVIAMADFLAESALRHASAPVIFDDPVNSLDYRRIEEVSSRIANLAEKRQVVVFTHNIWFATELLSWFERRAAMCSYFTIEDDGPVKGIVNAGTHPRWDTVKKLTGKVNSILQAARPAQGEVREALVERGYGQVRSWIEVVVEQEILQQVVQRYQPNVMLTRLTAIDGARLDVAKTVIYPIYEKACRIMDAHSQPLETLSLRPKLDELELEWAKLQDALRAYKQ